MVDPGSSVSGPWILRKQNSPSVTKREKTVKIKRKLMTVIEINVNKKQDTFNTDCKVMSFKLLDEISLAN